MTSRYAFLVETYETELLKVLSVWSMAEEADLDVRPRAGDRRGRTLREHMVHQCQSEHGWFAKMLGVPAPFDALPEAPTKHAFLRRYANAAAFRLEALRGKDDAWWEVEAAFFEVPRSRAWIAREKEQRPGDETFDSRLPSQMADQTSSYPGQAQTLQHMRQHGSPNFESPRSHKRQGTEVLNVRHAQKEQNCARP